jgi:hypothetical protein
LCEPTWNRETARRVQRRSVCAAPFVEHSTTVSVPLEPNGDFRIDDTLSSVPSEYPSPVLLFAIPAASGSRPGFRSLEASSVPVDSCPDAAQVINDLRSWRRGRERPPKFNPWT